MATHAGIAFASEHESAVRNWEFNSNSLVLLAVETEAELQQLWEFAVGKGLPVTAFHEPDIADELTAIALFSDEELGSVLDTLPLALRSPRDPRYKRECLLRQQVLV